MNSTWTFPGCPVPPDWTLDYNGLVDRFDWIAAMADCPQDPLWHAEGNVQTHVGMVCHALADLPAWRALPEVDRHIVFAAALLHDVAKPKVTQEEDGRLRSRGHALAGMRMARRILAEDEAFGVTGTPLAIREQICALVRHHGLPGTFLNKPDPRRSIITAAETARCDLLCILAEADARGRICAQPDDMKDRVAIFADFARECDCYDRSYPFASDHSRFRYHRTLGAEPTIDIYDASRATVTLMSGLPASGKDSWIRCHAADQPLISLDDLRSQLDIDPGDDQSPVIRAAKEKAKDYLRAGRSFVWNATNTTRMIRDGLIDLFAAYSARIHIVYCEAPPAEIRQRNARRQSPVPERVIEKLWAHLDVPDKTEAHRVISQ
jgi:putative nucleotidyltransferase with HDIG domain